MNVMLCFPVAEERQVRSGDQKLNLADDIQAGEESSLTSHSHNLFYSLVSDAVFLIKGKLSSTLKLLCWEKNLEVSSDQLLVITQVLG